MSLAATLDDSGDFALRAGPAPGHWIGSGAWTIFTAAPARQALLDAIDAARREPGTALSLDLAGVAEADSAGVQLLLAAARSLREAGLQGRLLGLAAPLREVAAALGCCDPGQCCQWPLQAQAQPSSPQAHGLAA